MRGIGINTVAFDIAHMRRIQRYARKIDGIYGEVIDFASRYLTANTPRATIEGIFMNPAMKVIMKEVQEDFFKKAKTVIIDGIENEWLQAGRKNDRFVDYIFRNSKLKKSQIAKFYDPNLKALKSFEDRKINGMNLSQRVWKYSKQFKTELELALELGLGEASTADELSRAVRKYLKEPNKLFRRVRDEQGVLQLSKAAKAYHPGQGVYRSSYKNAMRLTRTEINMAYRTADYERWQALDFIKGYEVRLSPQHPRYDICDELVGIYPKTFKFVGWHPQCMCHAIPVMLTPKEMEKFTEDVLEGKDTSDFISEREVNRMPPGFVKWAKDNQERAKKWKTQPYFIRDNFVNGQLEKGLKPNIKALMDIEPIKTQDLKGLLESLGYSVSGTEAEINSIMLGFDFQKFDSEFNKLAEKHLLPENIRVTKKGIQYHNNQVTMYFADASNMNNFYLVRKFYIENDVKIVKHDYLKLRDDVQGNGFTRELFKSLYEQYKNIGIQKIKVQANINVGGYAWARYGFAHQNRSDALNIFFRAKSLLTENEFSDFLTVFKKYENDTKLMWELASRKFGKKVFLGSNWYGYIDFRKPEMVKLFEDYLFSK